LTRRFRLRPRTYDIEEVRTMEITVTKVERIEATAKHDHPSQAA
jgi:hypothetical protein